MKAHDSWLTVGCSYSYRGISWCFLIRLGLQSQNVNSTFTCFCYGNKDLPNVQKDKKESTVTINWAAISTQSKTLLAHTGISLQFIMCYGFGTCMPWVPSSVHVRLWRRIMDINSIQCTTVRTRGRHLNCADSQWKPIIKNWMQYKCKPRTNTFRPLLIEAQVPI